MPARTFRLTNDEVETIKHIADRDGISQTEVIRRAIANLENATQENTGSSDSEMVKLLTQRLAVADAQVADLTQLVKSEQQLRLLSDGKKMHWWQRRRENQG